MSQDNSEIADEINKLRRTSIDDDCESMRNEISSLEGKLRSAKIEKAKRQIKHAKHLSHQKLLKQPQPLIARGKVRVRVLGRQGSRRSCGRSESASALNLARQRAEIDNCTLSATGSTTAYRVEHDSTNHLLHDNDRTAGSYSSTVGTTVDTTRGGSDKA